jgi:hypothetical protein
MVHRVLKRYGGLQHEAADEILFVDGEFFPAAWCDYQLGEAPIVAGKKLEP